MVEGIFYIAGSVPFLLTLVFIVLRAFNVIQWAWYWILSPIFILYLVVCVLSFILKAVEAIRDSWRWRKR